LFPHFLTSSLVLLTLSDTPLSSLSSDIPLFLSPLLCLFLSLSLLCLSLSPSPLACASPLSAEQRNYSPPQACTPSHKPVRPANYYVINSFCKKGEREGEKGMD